MTLHPVPSLGAISLASSYMVLRGTLPPASWRSSFQKLCSSLFLFCRWYQWKDTGWSCKACCQLRCMSRRNVGMPWELGWFLRQISTLKITIHTGSCRVLLSRSNDNITSNDNIDFAVSNHNIDLLCQPAYSVSLYISLHQNFLQYQHVYHYWWPLMDNVGTHPHMYDKWLRLESTPSRHARSR